MNRISWLLAGIILASGTLFASAQWSQLVELYHWVDFRLEAPGAADGIDKWDVEGTCVWTPESGAVQQPEPDRLERATIGVTGKDRRSTISPAY